MRWSVLAIIGCLVTTEAISDANLDEKAKSAFSNHAEAIALGQREFLHYWETKDPDTDFADYSEDERLEAWVETLEAFFAGNDDGGIEYIAVYAPAFSQYLLAQTPSFVLENELRARLTLADLQKQIAEENRIQAEENRIQADLQKQIAEENRIQADLQKQIAEENRIQADLQKQIAEENRKQEALDKLIKTLDGKSSEQ